MADRIDNLSNLETPAPPPDFLLGPLISGRQTRAGFRKSKQISLLLINNRADFLPVRLAGAGSCRINFPIAAKADPNGSIELRLSPGQTIIPVVVSPPPGPLVAFGNRVYHFTITGRTLAGKPLHRVVRSQIYRAPLIGPNALALLLLAFFGLGFYLFYLWTTPPARLNPVAVEFVPVTPLPEIAAEAINPAPLEPLSASQASYEAIFRQVAAQHNLDWRLLALQAYRESRLDPNAIGVNNDLGLMQIIPTTWNEWAPRVGVTDPFDPYSNILVGAAYMAFLRDHFAARGYPDDYWMLVAYNWGPANLEQFLEKNGHWTEVPHISRQYALEILEASPEASITWNEVELSLAERAVVK
jgi:hypothetical protein